MKEDAIKQVKKDFDILINNGLGLLGAFRDEQNIKPEHISLISNWISEAIDYIKPVMPMNYPKFYEICNIKTTYDSVVHVLPGDSSEHISQVLDCLKTAYKYFEIGSNYDVTKLPPETTARVFYEQIKATRDFAQQNIIGQLIGREDGRTKKAAMLHTYGRIYLWVQSMVALDSAKHFPALAGCLRAIFELYLDINLLANEIIKDGVEKFFSFPDVMKVKTAKNSLKLKKEFNCFSDKESLPMEQFLQNPPDKETQVQKLVLGLWGKTRKGKPNKPPHWTGKTVVDRVRDLKNDDIGCLYERTYYRCNWNVHSGYSDFPGAQKDDAHLCVADAYSNANEMFLDATELLNNELSIIDKEGLRTKIEKVQMVAPRLFWEESVKADLQD